jgi:hypothetical protein
MPRLAEIVREAEIDTSDEPYAERREVHGDDDGS